MSRPEAISLWLKVCTIETQIHVAHSEMDANAFN